MSNEFKLSYTGSGTPTIVGLLMNASGQFYNTGSSAFESYNAADVGGYAAVAMTQIGTTSEYQGNFPSAINVVGKYHAAFYKKAAATLAVSDIAAASSVGSADIEWTGSGELSLAVSQAAIPTAVWAASTRTITDLPADYLTASEQAALNAEATSSAVAALQTAITANGTAISGVAAATVTAMKADSQLAKTFNRVLGKFTYNVSTGVMTELLDDAQTVVGTNTITQTNGTITSRV